MNSLPLSLLFHIFHLTRFYRENRCLQILRNTVALNQYLGFSALSKFFLVCIKFDIRISKFRRFHKTKQTQNEVGRFFYNLAEFVSEYFCDSWRILTHFSCVYVESAFPETVSQSASCLPDVDCSGTFTARNTINNVI